ncbi:MAG: hypothetical protein DLM64_14735 [Solirubrobacterales bacterium]|nr:MAG: hypothetical protein DLM64_14735 [Solirubrobacterales bacterium]
MLLIRRKLVVAVVTVGALLAAIAVVVVPTASASCTLTLLGKPVINNLGLPLHSLGLGNLLNLSCGSSTPSTSSSPAQTNTTTPPGTTTQTQTQTQTPPGTKGRVRVQRQSARAGGGIAPGASGSHRPGAKQTGGTGPSPAPGAAPNALRLAGGIPSPTNPTFSFALPGPAPLGVPNFFIDSFRIPPFLIPIYQAAGIEYDIPWQVLAAINEIETDYGRNLSISSAGAVGWMQFLPATFKQYGVDANGDGIADPYNPVDAIFTAARYLAAAGGSKNITKGIFAYNHAGWYVQSVLLRAKLVGGIPDKLVSALTGLVQGHFPVAAPAKYADDAVERLATRRVKGANAAIPIVSNPNAKSTSIFARQGAPAIAVNDGKVVKVGQNAQLGKYLELQDATGNIYTYAQLGSIPKLYPVPKPVKVTAKALAQELSAPTLPSPKAPATAGGQATAGAQAPAATVTTLKASKLAKKSAPISLPVTPAPASGAQSAAPLVKERLFANPTRPASYAAGGALQLHNAGAQLQSFQDYFSSVLHLGRNQYTLQPLRAGSIVVAGTILGHVAAATQTTAAHMAFMVRPAGKGAPQIDPKPILDGWKLLEATAVYRAAGVDPFFGPGAKNPSVGQVLLMSKVQLTNRILVDPRVQIYTCGRRDIQAGLIDRRVLATIEFLSASGLDPSVSGLECGHSLTGSSGTDAAGATGSSVDIAKINNIPLQGHQGPGSITDITIRRLLTLQGAMKPDQVISLMSYKGQPNTLALPDHANRLQVTFTPLFGVNKKLSHEVNSILKPGQWIQLIGRISQIPEPIVPVTPSQYAIHKASP